MVKAGNWLEKALNRSDDQRCFHTGLIMVGTIGALSAFYHDSTDINDPKQRMIAADEAGLAASLKRLAEDADLRRTIGQANREKAQACFDEAAMIAAYRRLYSAAIGGDGLPPA